MQRIRIFNYLFGRVSPVSRLFGYDRGLPIDRYYIEKFLAENRGTISGTVIEVADSAYTKKFGAERVHKSLVLSFDNNSKADIVGDLASGMNIPEGIADCFVLTQTLSFIYDVKAAIKNAIRLLKPGGTLLVTVPGITQISRYDMDRWGHYWGFTDLSLRRLFEEVVPSTNISVRTYGNVKAASAFLYGCAANEIRHRALDMVDRDYQLLIAAKIVKG